MRVPSKTISPAAAAPRCSPSVPDAARSRVDFPAPLPPSTASTPSSGTSHETSVSAFTDRP
jgi:hypothetical protein